MQIFYDNNKVRKYCTDNKQATKKFGDKTAKRLLKTLLFIEAANSLSDLINYPPFNFHRLKGDKKHLCSIDIEGRKSKWRLYLIPCDVDCISLVEDYTEKQFEIIYLQLKEVIDHG